MTSTCWQKQSEKNQKQQRKSKAADQSTSNLVETTYCKLSWHINSNGEESKKFKINGILSDPKEKEKNRPISDELK